MEEGVVEIVFKTERIDMSGFVGPDFNQLNLCAFFTRIPSKDMDMHSIQEISH
jgi:hypothetical protein